MKNLPQGYKIEPIDDLTRDHENTFMTKGAIKKVLLEADDVVWRIIPGMKSPVFSDFWMDRDTMQTIMSIIRSRGDFSNDAKVEVFMQSLGILYKWGGKRKYKAAEGNDLMLERLNKYVNNLWKCKVTLKKPVVAYAGQTGPQKGFVIDEGESIRLERPVEVATEFKTGGFQQIVIPRFYKMREKDARDWGIIEPPVII